MELISILGYAGALLIGLSLGLIGGGGSILTVPILVYLLHVEPVLATAYSLFIVGLTSLVGSFTYLRKGLLDFKTAAVFAIPALLAVYFTRKFLIPGIPDPVIDAPSFVLTKGMLLMFIFAALMFTTSFSMIRQGKKAELSVAEAKSSFNFPLIVIEGVVVGILTGLVGAGGGFLIIPALVLLGKLPMKLAVGTSLLIISAKSLLGFLGDVGNEYAFDWTLLTVFSAIAVGGIFLGGYLSKFTSGQKLKPAFGWFVLVMAIYIIGREIMHGTMI